MERGMETIRVAALEDTPGLARMHVASWRETYVGILPDAMLSSLSVESRKIMWDQVMSQPMTAGSTVVHLAEYNEEIIGFGSCGSQRTEHLKEKGYDGEISAIYVLREYQGRGLGAKLRLAMAADLLSRGFSAAALWVLRDNPPARRFYERYGAQIIAEREDARGDTVLAELAYGWRHLEELGALAAW
jgi:ribosomal protein S18 acetylase RimI-like enzyme